MMAQPCSGKAGSHYADGVRKMYETDREMMGKDKIVISESNAEAYIGSLHANLALYGESTGSGCSPVAFVSLPSTHHECDGRKP